MARVLFRCDATSATGFGHLGRCLGLAEGFRNKAVDVSFLGHFTEDARSLLDEAAFDYSQIGCSAWTEDDVRKVSEHIDKALIGIILDSYEFSTCWLKALAESGVNLGIIDDFAALESYRPFKAVLNFRFGVQSLLTYSGIEAAAVAMGPTYFCPREALVKLRAQKVRNLGAPKNILIVLGGGDLWSQAMRIYNALREINSMLQLRVLVNDSHNQSAKLEVDPGDFPKFPAKMEEHYGWADACICGGGVVKYECAYLGLPVAMFSQTKGQQDDSDIFCEAQLGWDLTPHGDQRQWKSRLRTFVEDCHVSYPNRVATVFPDDSVYRATDHFLTRWGYQTKAFSEQTPQ